MASILLLEDEDNLRALLTEVLRRAGHQVIADRDGRRVADALLLAPIDLVITDVIMPDRDGIETILVLRRTHPKIPVIAISGGRAGNAQLYLQMAQKLGAARTLEKPFGTAALLTAVREALELASPP